MRSVLTIGLLLAAVPALAQPGATVAATASAPDIEGAAARNRLRVMESALEQVARNAAQQTSQRAQAASPDLLFFSGFARARGFRLDGYGVFFDVDLLAMRQSLTWSFRTVRRMQGETDRALDSLRQHVEAVNDQQARTELETALRLIELEMRPPAMAGGPVRGVPLAQTTAREAVEPVNFGRIYTEELQSALVQAMLDYGGTLRLGADEWLTVAARSSGELAVAPDPFDGTPGLILRIKGSDLTAFEAGDLTFEDARQRLDVRPF